MNAGDWRDKALLRGHQGPVLGVALSPKGEFAASVSGEDASVRLWDVPGQRQLQRFQLGTTLPMASVAFSPDGRLLAFTTGDEGTVRIVDVRSSPLKEGTPLAKAHGSYAWAVAFSPDSKVLATAGQDGRLALWDPITAKLIRDWQLPGPAYCLAFSADGRHLAVGNANGTLYILRLSQ